MEKKRLDFLVAEKLGVSRSFAVNLVENSKVKVDGKILTKPSSKIDENKEVVIEKFAIKESPLTLDLKVIYEDDNCVVIDKPRGVLAHSKGAFNTEETVASWLKPKIKDFKLQNNRAGIVHRLDRSTSGVMICAKNPKAMKHLQKQFSDRKVKKEYFALIENELPQPKALIDIPIERNPKNPKFFRVSTHGKKAQTLYETMKVFDKDKKTFSLIKLTPKTGRTHQLRVHLKHLKHPIIGDDFYGGIIADRLYLHAEKLELTIPGGIRKVFTSSLPDSFLNPKIK